MHPARRERLASGDHPGHPIASSAHHPVLPNSRLRGPFRSTRDPAPLEISPPGIETKEKAATRL